MSPAAAALALPAAAAWANVIWPDLGRHPAKYVVRSLGVIKSTRYFDLVRLRPDRAVIKETWIERVIGTPEHERAQADGTIRRWGRVSEAENRWLRVVLLEDGATVHNAFFDRRCKP